MLRGSALCILPSDSGFADEQTKCNSLRLRIRAGATRSACNPLAALAGQRTPNPKRRFGPQSSPTPGRRKPEETALGSAERGAPFWTNARIPSLAGRSVFDRIAARAICTVRCAAAREFVVPYLSLRSLPSPNRAAGEPASRDRARRDTPCEGSRGRPLGRAGRSNIENPAAESDVECISPDRSTAFTNSSKNAASHRAPVRRVRLRGREPSGTRRELR